MAAPHPATARKSVPSQPTWQVPAVHSLLLSTTVGDAVDVEGCLQQCNAFAWGMAARVRACAQSTGAPGPCCFTARKLALSATVSKVNVVLHPEKALHTPPEHQVGDTAVTCPLQRDDLPVLQARKTQLVRAVASTRVCPALGRGRTFSPRQSLARRHAGVHCGSWLPSMTMACMASSWVCAPQYASMHGSMHGYPYAQVAMGAALRAQRWRGRQHSRRARNGAAAEGRRQHGGRKLGPAAVLRGLGTLTTSVSTAAGSMLHHEHGDASRCNVCNVLRCLTSSRKMDGIAHSF